MLDLSRREFTNRSEFCQAIPSKNPNHFKVPTEASWRQEFGERLLDSIRRSGHSQRSFARRMKVTEGAVSRWVNGETDPSLPLMPRIARELHVPLDWLLGVPDAPAPPPMPDPKLVKRVVDALREGAELMEQLAPMLRDAPRRDAD